MAARNRLPPWHDRLQLSNGREILIRPIRPNDAAPLLAGFELLEPVAVRQRLVSAATPARLEPLTRPDPRIEFVLVAAEPEPAGEAVIDGLARIMTAADRRTAEFVVLAGPHIAGLGIDRQLLLKLVRWSRTQKLKAIHGLVDQDNGAIVELAESLGFTHEAGEEPGTIKLVLDMQTALQQHAS